MVHYFEDCQHVIVTDTFTGEIHEVNCPDCLAEYRELYG